MPLESDTCEDQTAVQTKKMGMYLVIAINGFSCYVNVQQNKKYAPLITELRIILI